MLAGEGESSGNFSGIIKSVCGEQKYLNRWRDVTIPFLKEGRDVVLVEVMKIFVNILRIQWFW